MGSMRSLQTQPNQTMSSGPESERYLFQKHQRKPRNPKPVHVHSDFNDEYGELLDENPRELHNRRSESDSRVVRLTRRFQISREQTQAAIQVEAIAIDRVEKQRVKLQSRDTELAFQRVEFLEVQK